MTALTSGSGNVGAGTLQRLTTGIRNIAFGNQAMQWLTTTSDNVDIGGHSSNAYVGNNNVGLGGVWYDGRARTIGNNNIHIGKRATGSAGQVSTNDSNIVIGSQSYTNLTSNTTILRNGMKNYPTSLAPVAIV
ncbi:hypothetical protein [Niastella sp. OAS944]|uniref:hypothetical protein n=1 Tax=Niastella sp. OAS944 TaxID=2664089 RepID=UPI00349AA90A|nr:hypothetical protein [Chitinophagaceae bacterium OAS944]